MYKSVFNSFLLFIFLSSQLSAQEGLPILSDSTRVQMSVTEVSLAFSGIELKIDGVSKNLKKNEKIIQIMADVDSVIFPIERELRGYLEKDIKVKKARRLENDLIYWNNQKEKVTDQTKIVSKNLDLLDEKLSFLRDLSAEVDDTYKAISRENESFVLSNSQKKLFGKISKLRETINHRRNSGLISLEKCTSVSEEIALTIETIEDLLVKRQADVFSSRMQPIYAQSFSDSDNWEITDSVKNIIEVETPELLKYFKENVWTYIRSFFLFLALSYIFNYISLHHKEKGIGDLSIFKRYFVVLLGKPFQLAFVITIFSIYIGNSSLPILLEDLFRLIIIVPISYLISLLIDKKHYHVLLSFGITIILATIYIFLPSEKIPARLLLAAIAVVEIITMLWSKKLLNGLSAFIRHSIVTKVFRLIIYGHAFTAFVALIVGLFGMVHLSELLVRIVFGDIYLFILLGVVLIVLNGSAVMLIEGKFAENINSIRDNKIKLIKRTTNILNFIFLLILFHYIFRIIGVDTIVYDGVVEWLSKNRSIGTIKFSIGGIITFFLVIYFSIVVSRVVKNLLDQDVLVKLELDQGLSHTISTMARYTIITFGVLLAMRSGGLKLTEFAIVLSAFGVGIGFGLQNIFNNLVSGFILLFERPINIGDTVEVGTLIGNVRKIGIRSSNVRTFDGAEIIVPNGNLISNEVINWTLSDRTRRIELLVGVSYDADPRQVQKILLKTVNKHEGIVKNPEPIVFFKDFGESSLDFRMLFWTTKFDEWVKIKSDVMFEVFDALKEAGIEIPFPQRDLHLRSIDSGVELKSKKD